MANTLKLFKLKNYSRLYIAGLFSEMATFILETAVLLYVFDLTNQNNSYLGIAHGTFLTFFTLGGLIGGPLGNNYNRKEILIFCEVSRIPLIIGIFFAKTPLLVLLFYGLVAFLTGLFNPSRQTLVNEFVPQDQIKDANALFGTTFAFLHLIGPLLGSQFYVYFSGVHFTLYLNIFSYLFGIFLLIKINYNISKKRKKTEVFKEVIEGYHYLNKRPDLKALFNNTLANGFCIGILIALTLPFCTQILNQNKEAYGWILTAFGLGGLFGGTICKYFAKKTNHGKIIMISFLLEVLSYIWWIRIRSLPLSLIVIFIWGIIVFARITAQLNHISDSVETQMLSRLHALVDLAFVIPSIGAGMIVGLFGNKYDPYELMNFAGYTFLILFILRIPLKGMRSLYFYKTSLVQREIQKG